MTQKNYILFVLKTDRVFLTARMETWVVISEQDMKEVVQIHRYLACLLKRGAYNAVIPFSRR